MSLQEVVDVIACLAGLVAILDYFGIKPKKPADGVKMTLPRKFKLAIMLALVGISLGLSGYSFYRSRHPKIIDRIVEKPVERIVEKPVSQNCPPVPSTEHRAGKTPPTASIQQSNSGGLNIQQATTGERSPIVNSPITVGQIPKTISAQDKVSLSELFTRGLGTTAGKTITISADQYSAPSPFISDFYDLISGAHWPMREAQVNQIIGFGQLGPKRFQGAVLILHGEPLKEGEQVKVDSSDPLYYIGTALQSLNVPMIVIRKTDFQENAIGIQFEGGFPDTSTQQKQ